MIARLKPIPFYRAVVTSRDNQIVTTSPWFPARENALAYVDMCRRVGRSVIGHKPAAYIVKATLRKPVDGPT